MYCKNYRKDIHGEEIHVGDTVMYRNGASHKCYVVKSVPHSSCDYFSLRRITSNGDLMDINRCAMVYPDIDGPLEIIPMPITASVISFFKLLAHNAVEQTQDAAQHFGKHHEITQAKLLQQKELEHVVQLLTQKACA